jgi:hypothetical protein
MKVKSAIQAFKVCRGRAEKALSAIHRKSNVAYSLDRVTRPKVGRNPFLFVFRSLASAERFLDGQNCYLNYIIFRGVAINPKRQVVGRRNDIKTHEPTVLHASTYPKGTVFCDAFVPLAVERNVSRRSY